MYVQEHNIEQQNHVNIAWFHSFTFTGKERDSETGFGYFGARYMDYELMTMWLSVDPMADKFFTLGAKAERRHDEGTTKARRRRVLYNDTEKDENKGATLCKK